MLSSRAQKRFLEIIATATDVFIARGYRRAKMEDVTQRLQLSAGAIYRYVESKSALFDVVLRANTDTGLNWDEIELPLPTPAAHQTEATVRRLAQLEQRLPALFQDDDSADLPTALGQLFDELNANRDAIKMIEASALDWPELADIWFGDIRRRVLQRLSRALQIRSEQSAQAIAPQTQARFAMVGCAYFAIHRHYDAAAAAITDAEARRAAVTLLSAALAQPQLATP